MMNFWTNETIFSGQFECYLMIHFIMDLKFFGVYFRVVHINVGGFHAQLDKFITANNAKTQY